MKFAISCGILLSIFVLPTCAQKAQWRQATGQELASVLPSRAQVETEHIETEMRTASGIVNGEGKFIAGVVLLTAGYSADGKYSHYLVTQLPLHIAGSTLPAGDYLVGWTRSSTGDVLDVHFNDPATGKLTGTAQAKRLPGRGPVTSIRIWPPQSGAMIQIGRFGIPYKLDEPSPKK